MTHSELRRAAKNSAGMDKKVVKAESELRNIFHELKRREQESVKKKKSAREIAEDDKRFGEISLQRAREEEFQGLVNKTDRVAASLKREDELLAFLWKRDEREAKAKVRPSPLTAHRSPLTFHPHPHPTPTPTPTPHLNPTPTLPLTLTRRRPRPTCRASWRSAPRPRPSWGRARSPRIAWRSSRRSERAWRTRRRSTLRRRPSRWRRRPSTSAGNCPYP